MTPVKVLVVDDSALVRQIITQGLNLDPNITVVGGARDPYEARDLVVKLQPDVMTLDVNMPRMDGLTFLKKLMEHMPMPVIMVSTLTKERAPETLDALDAGAIDFVAKPTAKVARLEDMMLDLRAKVKSAARVRVRKRAPSPRVTAPTPLPAKGLAWQRGMLAIGASTGGTEALKDVLDRMPPNTPGTVIVQHMPAAFTGAFAARLNKTSPMRVVEAQHGMAVAPGVALLSPGGKQMRVIRKGNGYIVTVNDGPLVQGHAPSVDVLFNSVAEQVGNNAVSCILTGMGADGAAGMLAMRNAGARTVAQDEKSCVVFGMPKAAINNGGAELVRPLLSIPTALCNLLRSSAKATA